MFVYLFVLLYILFIFRVHLKTENGYFIKLLLAFLAIFALMALRYDWTGDYWAYDEMFDRYHDLDWADVFIADNGNIEIGFKFLLKICYSYRCLIVVTSFIICCCIFFFFYKIIPEKWAPIAFVVLFIDRYLLLGDISGIRNALAVSIFIVSLYHLMKGKRILYLIMVYFASYFHTSALFMLPFVILSHKRIIKNPTRLMIMFGIYIFLCAILIGTIGEVIDNFINGNMMFERYVTYTKGIENRTYSVSLFAILTIPMLYYTVKTLCKNGLSHTDYFLLNGSLLWYLMIFFPSIAFNSRFYFYIDYLFIGGAVIVLLKAPEYRKQFILFLLLYFVSDYIRYVTSEHFLSHLYIYHTVFE